MKNTARRRFKWESTRFLILLALLVLGVSMTSKAKIIVRASKAAALEREIKAKTGLGSVGFNASGALTFLMGERPQGGSQKYRQLIIGAASDPLNVFLVEDHSGSRGIHFAETDEGTKDIVTGITTYRIRLDFGDFENSRSYTSREVRRSFTTGIALFHEIDHKVSYDPMDPIPASGVRPDKSTKHVRGVIENANIVRNELSLMKRRPTQHKGKLYKGVVASFRGMYEIEFTSDSGKRKHLRWKI